MTNDPIEALLRHAGSDLAAAKANHRLSNAQAVMLLNDAVDAIEIEHSEEAPALSDLMIDIALRRIKATIKHLMKEVV